MDNKKKIISLFAGGLAGSAIILGTPVMADTENFPEHFSEEVNGVSFDTEIELPEGLDLSALTTATAVLQKLDTEKAASVLLSGKTVEKEELHSFQGDSGTIDARNYILDDGTLVNLDMMLTYSTPFCNDVRNAFRVEKTEEFNADNYRMDGELGFDSVEASFEKVTDIIESCGYRLEQSDYISYALDAVTMQAQERITDKAGAEASGSGRNWESEDDCYSFYAEQTYEDLPVYYGSQVFPDDGVTNRPIQAIYSVRGLEELRVTNLYEFTSTGEKVELLDFNTLAEKVASKYGDLLTTAKYQVNRARLYQMPAAALSGDYKVRPVWLFEVLETGTDSETGSGYTMTSYTFLDAQTGEEVAVG